MTLADTATHDHEAVSALPPRRRRRRLVLGVAIVLLLVSGGVIAGTYYYDTVPLVESNVSYPVVPVAELPPPVVNAFVAAVDPDFYVSDHSLITRRYTVIASGGGEKSYWRTWVMADKAEESYTKTEILDRYLNRADYGRGAVGLDAAARTYFAKPAAQLTVAEWVLLAVRLHPDRPAPKAGWEQVLDTMVERGWLSPAERNSLAFPG
ncbi:transglycosylase domain-containing protein [Amorphoplanes digitatis]|uniref:Membrane peptidoglycan carboxypeptidase n=1 Tax=Actinoplanes digitatis TaxID=1868 RepID=A0A7W7MPD1_9ACTN|nr:transglycosylase domain-containing protein [Actinoplanes digitatis]MBB4761991.1 membrane peptidoglycan carboxypeptidase [Actinoplanes digitatis]